MTDYLRGEMFAMTDANGERVELIRKDAFDKSVRDLMEARTAQHAAELRVSRLGLALKEEEFSVQSLRAECDEARSEARRLAEELAEERSLRIPHTPTPPSWRRPRKW